MRGRRAVKGGETLLIVENCSRCVVFDESLLLLLPRGEYRRSRNSRDSRDSQQQNGRESPSKRSLALDLVPWWIPTLTRW